MHWISLIVVMSALASTSALAIEPVIMSGPVPPIQTGFAISDTPQTLVYTVTNRVPKKLPITVSGISAPLTRVPVANDCDNILPAGTASCNIGIQVAVDEATIIQQTLSINYEGRASVTSPISIVVAAPFAYVSPAPNATEILQFPLDTSNGAFSSSPITAYTDSPKRFDELTFAVVGGVQYGYAVDQNGYVYQCHINADGTFSSCARTPEFRPEWEPHGIAFATVNGVQYAYVVSVNSLVFRCSLNVGGATNGSFKSCSVIYYFEAPYGISFATTNGSQYAYIASAGPGDGFPGDVYQCSLAADGSFNSCENTPMPDAPDWVPYTVTFETVNGTQYAYVADNGLSTPGKVYRCTLNKDGSFKTCQATPSVNPTINWVPSDIAFATLEGVQYAYVANYQGSSEGGMYVCTLNSDGTFNTCTPTPNTTPSPWQPVGIAFRF